MIVIFDWMNSCHDHICNECDRNVYCCGEDDGNDDRLYC